jgi:hypothetical protein
MVLSEFCFVKIMYKKLQFQIILLRYKKWVIDKTTYVNKGCNLIDPYLLTVLLSIPFNKFALQKTKQTKQNKRPEK